MIIEKDNKYNRIQIKTVQNNSIPFRKISHNMGKYKIKRYTKEDIDYFVGVDIKTEDIYILPISLTETYKHSISINKCKAFLNNFKQMEPINGNINSGEDDNVETLAGNDVGTI